MEKTKKRSFLIALVCCLALAASIALVGCGGGGSNQDAAKNFIGTWEAESAEADGESLDAETMNSMRSYGMNMVLTLSEDKNASLDIFGEVSDGTWEAKSETSSSVKFTDGTSLDLKLEDGKLIASDSSSSIVFVRNNDAESSTIDLDGDGGDAQSVEATPINQVIGDDENCKVEVLSIEQDSFGDPGFNLKVTNKSDKTITLAEKSNSWSVGGKTAELVGILNIEPGTSDEHFFHFDPDELGGGIDALVDVDGYFLAYDSDTYDDLSEYHFTY